MYTCICIIVLHAVKCPTLPIIEHMMSYDHVNTAGNTVTFECVSGYSIVGPNRLYCQLDGSWNSTVPYCVAVTPTGMMSSSSILNSYSTLHITSSSSHEPLSTSATSVVPSSSIPQSSTSSHEVLSTSSSSDLTLTSFVSSSMPSPSITTNSPIPTNSIKVQTSVSPTPAQSQSSVHFFSGSAMDHAVSSLHGSTSISLTTLLPTGGGQTISHWISPSENPQGLLCVVNTQSSI